MRSSSIKKTQSITSLRSSLESALAFQLQAAAISVSAQWRAIPNRKYTFDFFITPDLLIECEGGIFIKGGHSTGVGITRDIEKGNLAVLHGFRLLRFTREMIESGAALETIEAAIAMTFKSRRNGK